MTQPEGYDPTAININFDPLSRRMKGKAFHGNKDFDVPYISEVLGTDNLWQGGCTTRPLPLALPQGIKNLVSLYPWEQYEVLHDLDSRMEVRMYDSVREEVDMAKIERIADWINAVRRDGPTLVHCQAGLNRSGFVTAIALLRDGSGRTPEQAIEMLRSSRSPAVLCNPLFESMVLEYR